MEEVGKGERGLLGVLLGGVFDCDVERLVEVLGGWDEVVEVKLVENIVDLGIVFEEVGIDLGWSLV